MKKNLVLLAAIASVTMFYQFGGEHWLNPETYQSLYRGSPQLTIAMFFSVYVLVTALSIPGAALMTLIAGVIFGTLTGTILVSFASSLGATAAFLIARLVVSDWVQEKFKSYIDPINRGMEKEGALYLFGLRLVPLFPFFVINLVMSVTNMRAWTFYLVSQIGMLPATFVYVNAGAQLGQIDELSLAGILTPRVIAGFTALAILPFIARAILNSVKRNLVYKPWKHLKPKAFDTNLIVIGAGSAGLVSAYIAAATKAKVTLIERDKMGGDCLNTGCVPSKAMIRSAQIKKYVQSSSEFGIDSKVASVDFSQVMTRVNSIVKAIEPHDSIERYTELGVDCVMGKAEVVSPWEVKVGDQSITAPNIILATGADPLVPPISGLSDLNYLTSDNLWDLREQPKRVMVLGGGPIGCEMAQSFRRLGSQVTIVDMAPRLLPREDADVSSVVLGRFVEEGINVLVDHKTVAFESVGESGLAKLSGVNGEVSIEFDRVIVAVGRKARSLGAGFDALELERTPNGLLEVDEYLATKYPNIYACGDLVGPFQFTHVASHQAWFASVNALFGKFKKFKVDYRVIPWATFTDPEVAHVGLSESEALRRSIAFEVTKYGLNDLDRAIADSETAGFVKVLTPPGSDKILGATIVGYQASNLLAEFVLAMKHGLGLNKILGTIHVYPTLSESVKFVAGNWRRTQVKEWQQRFLKRFHRSSLR